MAGHAGTPAHGSPGSTSSHTSHSGSTGSHAAATGRHTTNAPHSGKTTRLAPRTEGLKGTSASMPLLSVFQFLGRMRKHGTMHVNVQGEQVAFDLQNGCITATATDRCPLEEHIGQLLIERGHCTRSQLDSIAELADAGAQDRFGQLALQAGLCTPENIADVLEQQVRRRLARACKCPEATYEFVEGTRAAAEARYAFSPIAIA
jgi:hypothetical protein